MTLILDTSILIDIEKEEKNTINKIKDITKNDPVPANITFINYFEFIHGIREKSPKNKEISLMFIEEFHCLQTTKKTSRILSDLKYKYENLGKSFYLADLIIASQAIENNMTLVTKDRQFNEIEELKKIIL